MRRKNTIEISPIYWNVLLWIFSPKIITLNSTVLWICLKNLKFSCCYSTFIATFQIWSMEIVDSFVIVSSVLSCSVLILSKSVLKCQCLLTKFSLFSMGLFGSAQVWGGQKGPLLPKICQTYPTMMKLGFSIFSL